MLKIVKRIVLLPVWILVQILRGTVHVMLGIYSRIGGLVWLAMLLLAILAIGLREWQHVAFLAILAAISFAILFAGAFVEVAIESAGTFIAECIKN